MGKYHCTCGWTISNVSWPAHEGRRVISDADLDRATNYVSQTIDKGTFDECARHFFECSQCGRIHVQEVPRVNRYATFVKEVADGIAHVQALEVALAEMLWIDSTNSEYDEVRKKVERLLKREGLS